MAEDAIAAYTSFLGTGWSFPPEFVLETGTVVMTTDEEDVAASLKILLGTAVGERFLNPKYGLDMTEVLFEPLSTTMKTFLHDRIKTTLLIYEPRIDLLDLTLDTSTQYDGKINIVITYQIRGTNSRFNLVYPFYTSDSNEVRQTVDFS
ncbi:MAG TPA: GPW/gp25 family protein [Trichocoleus sp.]|jgi:phage baseplate assembly protein W